MELDIKICSWPPCQMSSGIAPAQIEIDISGVRTPPILGKDRVEKALQIVGKALREYEKRHEDNQEETEGPEARWEV